MQQHVDDRILEMLLSNDQHVIQLLYATYYTPLRKVLRRRIADEQTANDIVVELILSLWEKRHQLALRKPLMGYLSTAVRAKRPVGLKMYHIPPRMPNLPAPRPTPPC
jgi:DNA-directed RNA polymerase specialized sigma24 family protein